MSLRRSSRAPPPAHTNSSSSLSSRDRVTRSNDNYHTKPPSARRSTSPHSLSSVDTDDTALSHHSEERRTRRCTRARDYEGERATKLDNEPDDELVDDNYGVEEEGEQVEDDEEEEEEETTRCICGQQEYPGPPSDDADLAIGSGPQAEDVGGLFIQCDKCKVWQHGGCVGIMVERLVPDNYFCEECRSDLHSLVSSSKGQKYSRYIPVVGQKAQSKHAQRKVSVSKDAAESRNPKEKDKPLRSTAEATTKRRSTMNSRAAYDDDEVLRQVLEDSKCTVASSENGSWNSKRSHDSEEAKPAVKRQRTGSGDAGTPTPSDVPESDESRSKTNPGVQKQKPRGAAARSQQERIAREQKEKERERTEACGKRKGRADQKHSEDLESEPTQHETTDGSEQADSETAAARPGDDTPTIAPAPVSTSKKPAKSSGGPKRVGNRTVRNQHSRDPVANSVDKTPGSPVRNGLCGRKEKQEHGSSVNGLETVKHGSGSDAPATTKHASNGKKAGQAKPAKVPSWKDMFTNVNTMLGFISAVQLDMASVEFSGITSTVAVAKVAKDCNSAPTSGLGANEEKEYEKMSSLEMMDHLTRDLLLWQRKFGPDR